MKLKMLSSHPGLLDPTLRNLPSKSIQKTPDLVANIKGKNEKVLIFTEYREMQNILKGQIIDKFGIVPPIINGMTDRRQQVVDEFNTKPGFDVMILSHKAAGTGLTITSANHVIHYTRWWNPAVENQATDRVYRIGQEKNVTVYFPIVTDEKQSLGRTVEEIVDKLLEEKQQLSTNIIVPSQELNIEKMLLETMNI
ncbi:DEAD/DEAH box helicase [Bacillus sinesaloumensis]|uniref:DEAD/DEAH box helicase n=1 Tax=Litchfieldia sinesaloumensis TaxID=1926280 RepID=UPI0009889038|nr:C-terminal helicase domain-containing protein [Bacillus sinesaloumensis]